MFVRDVVTIERDTEILADKDDFIIYQTRVSNWANESFQNGLDEAGKPKYSRRVFMDATFKVNKITDDKGGKRPFVMKDQLTKGTLLFVENGSIGVDEVPSTKEQGKKAYFPKLKASRIRPIGRVPEKQPAAPTTAMAPTPTSAPAATSERLEPRTPYDDGDRYKNVTW